jgi:hypothetical protein
VGLNHFALGSSFFIIEGLVILTVEASTSSGMDATSTTTSEFVAFGVDLLAFGVDFLASRIDFFRFPPFLTKSFA